MAYYGGSNFYNDGVGEYHWTPYSNSYDNAPTQDSIFYSRHEFSEPKFIEYHPTDYDLLPSQDSISYSSHEFSEPKFIEYNPADYGGAYEFSDTEYHPTDYDPFLTQSEISYSTYNFIEPKFIKYNPTPYGTGYFSPQTHSIVSYSTSEFNEPDFIEYNPTPYGGGYDIAQTYGKPLPASDEICHPRSMSEPGGGNGSKPAKGTEEEQRSQSQTKGIEEEQQSHGGSGLSNGQLEKPLDSNQGGETEGHTPEDNYPWSGYNHARSEDCSYGYGYDKQVPQPPYGYDSDAIDFCESIFGYWPCLSRKDWKSHGGRQVADEESKDNHWNGAADYLFGSSEPRNGVVNYSYQRHYQEQPYYRQLEYDDNSTLQHFRSFEDCNNPS
uniref:Uncharacterized protein n=1 Tax=Davidia involucrata TaxID=16924 RepID=A0A5B7BRB3_DAVIN